MRTLLTGFILLTIILPCTAQQQSVEDSVIARFNLHNGETFVPLALEDTAGNVFHTNTLSGKTVYVDFWFTTCPPCITEIPHHKQLQQYFRNDTNVVFLSICIENIGQKGAWKKLVKEKELGGVQLFYTRNRPQQYNLLRLYDIIFPTYLLLDKQMKIIGYDAPRPSEKGWVQWALVRAAQGQSLSASYQERSQNSAAYRHFLSAGRLQDVE